VKTYFNKKEKGKRLGKILKLSPIFFLFLLSISLVSSFSQSQFDLIETVENITNNYNNTYINQTVNATINETQFDSNDPIHIKESWLESFVNALSKWSGYCLLTGCNMTGDLNINASIHLPANRFLYFGDADDSIFYQSTDNHFHFAGTGISYFTTTEGIFNFSSDNIVTEGNITADYFIGDGSQLTGIQQGNLILFFLEKDAGEHCSECTGKYSLESEPNSTEVTLIETSLGDGETLIGEWITKPYVPSVDYIPDGNWLVHVEGKKTGGTKDVQFFYRTYKTNLTGGDEVLLGESGKTDNFDAVRTNFDIWKYFNGTDMETTDRIMVRGYAFVSGGGSAPSIEAYIQGASHTRLEIPIGAVSVEKFIPYTGAINNVDLGTKNITASNFFGTLYGLWNGSSLYSKISDLVSYVGNWSADKGNYYNKTQSDGNWSKYLLKTGDTATGNYNFDSNTFVIDAGSNRVGIGTDSPDEKLDVDGNIKLSASTPIIKATEPILKIESSTGVANNAYMNIDSTDDLFRLHGGVSGTFWLTGAGATNNLKLILGQNLNQKWALTTTTHTVSGQDPKLHIRNNADTVVMTYAQDGKVGIGTTTPASFLDVKGDGSATNIIRGTDSGGVIRYRLDQSFNSYWRNSSGTDVIKLATTADSYINTGYKFGIGTASPAFTLTSSELSSGSKTRPLNIVNPATADGTAVGLTFTTSTTTTGISSEIVCERVNSGNYNDLAFSTNNNGALSEKMRIRYDGKVGIGTTSPAEKLDVNGSIIATGYKSSDGSAGITNTTGFWLCGDSDCNSTCQVSIKNGLITGCA